MAGIVQINTIGWWLKQRFGCKVVKLSLDGGFTCPNRDGTCGTGGCIFCSAEGSGELASPIGTTAESAIREQIELRREKWPNVSSFIAYFQNNTNTYAPASELEVKYRSALSADGVIGLAIATRPDCLSENVLDLLEQINKETFLWVELGLQTIHGDRINRGYDLSVYDKAVCDLHARGIRIVTHLILGLPGESKEDMTESVKYVTRSLPLLTKNDPSEDAGNRGRYIFGLKLHLLNIVKGAPMETMYPGYTPFDTPEEYIDLVCDLLEIIPENITIHRLTGDVPRNLLVSPWWSYKKRTILNGIARELRYRKSLQGCRSHE